MWVASIRYQGIVHYVDVLCNSHLESVARGVACAIAHNMWGGGYHIISCIPQFKGDELGCI